MTAIDTLAKDFLDQKCIAVAGVSLTRQTPANAIFKLLRDRGATVFAINPKLEEFMGERCYHGLEWLPQKPDGVMIVTNPTTTESLVRECVAQGVKRVWLHSALGTKSSFMKNAAANITSVSPVAVQLCRDNGIAVIPGSCPLQFAGDIGHKCMRGFLRILGALQMEA